MAVLIPCYGSAREVRPAHGRAFTLAELQTAVGGFIEMLHAPDGRLLFINEDGKRLRLPINDAATILMQPWLGRDVILGDVILCTREEVVSSEEGDERADDPAAPTLAQRETEDR